MRIDNATVIESAIESILICTARIIGYFYPAGSSCRVVVDVEIRGFVKAVKYRTDGRWGEVIVDVSVARLSVIECFCDGGLAYTVTSLSSPGSGGMLWRGFADTSWQSLL